MGIFDLFKKLARKKEIEEIVTEKISFSELEDWVTKKKKENELKEKEILAIILEKIKRSTEEIREKIIILESVDIKSKKERDDIKEVVNSSKINYIKSVEEFLDNLNDLEMNRFEESARKINNIFLDFNKGSYKNYERATILIGKEMGSIRENLRLFSRELIKTFNESKEIVDSFKKIALVKSQLNMIFILEETLKKISETTLFLGEKIKIKEEENEKLLKEIEEIKRSPGYLENIRNQKKIESLKEELKNDIFRLRQVIDFKALANFFHINEEQMKILKKHREDFQTNFQRDNGKIIIDFLEESKLNNEIILEKVNLIRTKVGEISNHESGIGKDETQELDSQVKIIFVEIDNLKIEKVKEEKRDEKIKINKEELIDSLKQELGKMNVEMI